MLTTQSCLTLWDSMNCGPPTSSIHGILQARILEWAAISYSARIFPPQGLNLYFLCLLHQQVDSLTLSHLGIQIGSGGTPKLFYFYEVGITKMGESHLKTDAKIWNKVLAKWSSKNWKQNKISWTSYSLSKHTDMVQY